MGIISGRRYSFRTNDIDGGRSAADKMDDLQFVSRFELSFVPTSARCDVAIQFHGDTVRFKPKVFDELRERQPIRALLLLAVDDQGHTSSLADVLRGALWLPTFIAGLHSKCSP